MLANPEKIPLGLCLRAGNKGHGQQGVIEQSVELKIFATLNLPFASLRHTPRRQPERFM